VKRTLATVPCRVPALFLGFSSRTESPRSPRNLRGVANSRRMRKSSERPGPWRRRLRRRIPLPRQHEPRNPHAHERDQRDAILRSRRPHAQTADYVGKTTTRGLRSSGSSTTSRLLKSRGWEDRTRKHRLDLDDGCRRAEFTSRKTSKKGSNSSTTPLRNPKDQRGDPLLSARSSRIRWNNAVNSPSAARCGLRHAVHAPEARSNSASSPGTGIG
jgi:hypothetical protein